jgi:hypothetical protein
MNGARWRGRTPPGSIESDRPFAGTRGSSPVRPLDTSVTDAGPRFGPFGDNSPAAPRFFFGHVLCVVLIIQRSTHEVMTGMETAQTGTIDQLHDNYVAARKAYKDAERKFSTMVAGFHDIPAELNTRLDYIEVTAPDTVAVNPPPVGPPWAQPATPPQKHIITRRRWPRIDEYIEAFSDLKRKLEEAQRLYASLPELDRQLGSQYRSPLEP